MEVDDAAIVMAEDKTVLESSVEGGGEEQQIMPSSSTTTRQKRFKLKHDKEEPPGEMDTHNNDSMLTATPFKLEVSGSEDDEKDNDDDAEMPADVKTKATIRRKLLSTPLLEEDGEAKDGLEDYEEVALKRKRYEVRRSGSEECLLGFDEQSGEAELIKAEDVEEEEAAGEPPVDPKAEELVEEPKKEEPLEETKAEAPEPEEPKAEEPKAEAPKPELRKQIKVKEEVTLLAKASPASSPRSAKKSPPRKPSQSPQQILRSVTKSPLAVKPKSPQVETPPVLKAVQKTPPPKPHIVGDGEETNGQNDNMALMPLQTPVLAAASDAVARKPLSPQDDFYRKPFEFGWKRELVWRANLEISKDKADVYFISPAGKKLRTRNEIIPLLEGDLTIDHFCFVREPLGASPDLEIVRSAKPSSRAAATSATLAAAASPPIVGKRVSKPKGPKGASPPPQGWTASKALKVNNAALLSASGGGSGGRLTSASQQTLFPQHMATPPSSRKHDTNAPQHNSSSHSAKSSNKTKKSSSSSASTFNNHPQPFERRMANNNAVSKETCSISCAKAAGQLPQLQCTKCFCLFHHECVGIDRQTSDYRTTSSTNGREYICEICGPKPVAKSSSHQKLTPPNASVAAVTTTVSSQTTAAVTASLPRPPAASGVTASKGRQQENKQPQTIAVVKGKKYVMVAKPLTLPNEHVNDIENDLKQINESIRKNRKQSNNSQDGSSSHSNLNSHNSQVASDQSSKLFATNFFANVSYAYDSLLCILKYLKIHERPRAAAVCKLWNLAAKDTSLWQTVRMKNSKVCSWSGFAAALRRGETKHLDLRKMLLPSGRSEDLWNDFCENVGTVCSLENIDLCRCSARVVESLFQSNRHLKIINALAINDDTINLENIALVSNLEELRLRTCESGVLAGDITPFASLTQLTHLSLTSIKGLGAKRIEVLGELTTLKSLELGECGDFDSTFAEAVLPKLINLQRLRLENGQEINVCTLEILDAVARLVQLQQLELVNFDIKPGFDEKLSLCMNITKLLIIPTYISQSATTNQIVLSAVQQVAETLKVFTWCVTVELLRVTALYVDQCEVSTKKEKHHFDECIPVLKPVPGAPLPDDDDEENCNTMKLNSDDENNPDVPQIEILPLDKVESILSDNLPDTKFTIVKVPYHVTCKQQLVD